MKQTTKSQVLAPKCCSDLRPRVVCSYIRLLALVPSFNVVGQEYAGMYQFKPDFFFDQSL